VRSSLVLSGSCAALSLIHRLTTTSQSRPVLERPTLDETEISPNDLLRQIVTTHLTTETTVRTQGNVRVRHISEPDVHTVDHVMEELANIQRMVREGRVDLKVRSTTRDI